MTFNRASVYKFLAELTNKYPEDAVGILKDIIVDYWFFPAGDGADYQILTDLEKEVADFMAQGQKIHAIKRVREVTRMNLKEAKEYVEQRNWPTGGARNEIAENMRQRAIAETLKKLSQDYRIPIEE